MFSLIYRLLDITRLDFNFRHDYNSDGNLQFANKNYAAASSWEKKLINFSYMINLKKVDMLQKMYIVQGSYF